MNLYRLLEDIKDRQATTSKYDNDNIRFKTPNTVMIFSNKYPNLRKLTKDRWLVLLPNYDGLKDFTCQLQKMKYGDALRFKTDQESRIKNLTIILCLIFDNDNLIFKNSKHRYDIFKQISQLSETCWPSVENTKTYRKEVNGHN